MDLAEPIFDLAEPVFDLAEPVFDLLKELKELKKQNGINIAKNINKEALILENREITAKIKELEPIKEKIVKVNVVKKKGNNKLTCDNCCVSFIGKSEIVCDGCYKNMYANNILEVVCKDHTIIFNANQVTEAEEYLSNICCNLRLDLHGVINTIDSSISLSNACIISFVGKNSATRKLARNDIRNRIESKQVDIGFLNFKWVKNDSIGVPGSKSWINKLIKFKDSALFIDDNISHVLAVRDLKIDGLVAYCLKSNESLLQVLRQRCVLPFKTDVAT